MYIIDANYSQYEANFGRQNAQLGFAADSVSQGLNTAGALFVVVPTVRILSGVAGGITGIKGSYQSDLLGSKTVEIIQSQMRANRDEVQRRSSRRWVNQPQPIRCRSPIRIWRLTIGPVLLRQAT